MKVQNYEFCLAVEYLDCQEVIKLFSFYPFQQERKKVMVYIFNLICSRIFLSITSHPHLWSTITLGAIKYIHLHSTSISGTSFAPGGVAQWCEILRACMRSFVRVVVGTMWGVGFQQALRLICWLSWGAKVRFVAPRSQQLWLNLTFPNGGASSRSCLGGKPHMVALAPLFFIKKKKKKSKTSFTNMYRKFI